MGDTKSLSNREATEKIKEIAKGQICLLCTYENEKMVSRPMGTSGIDDNGDIWFLSNKESDKNQQIKKDHSVYLMFMNAGKQQYLSLSGRAEIVLDRSKIDELWNPLAKAWFEEGKDDPSISLIRVRPIEGHYWDTKNGKLVSMIKIAVAAVTGKQMDGGVDGDIKLSNKVSA